MLTCPDAHYGLKGKDEDLAVANLAGSCGGNDDIDGLAGGFVRDGDLDFHLGEKIDGVFAATVNLGVALLAAEAFDFADRHALDAGFGQGVFDLFEFEWLDNGDDEFHASGDLYFLINGWWTSARRS